MRLTKEQCIEKEKLFKQGLKQCPKCDDTKPLSKFGKNKSKKDGLQSYCKKHCSEHYLETREQILQRCMINHIKYPWKGTLNHIKQRCENINCKDYKYYGGRGIENRLTEEDCEFMYHRDRADLMINPSIDRIDNDGNYELSNCEYIERGDNTIKTHNVKILQYDLNDNFIKEWDSQTVASVALNIDKSNISKCCLRNKHHKRAGKFKWKFK